MAPRVKRGKRKKFEPESVQKALVNLIIVDELSFSVVERDEIKKVMETEFPDFQVPSSEMISRACVQLFMDEKLKLKSFIKNTKQKVCLSLNTWRSNQSVNYLSITAHFIDNGWNLHKKVIGFSPIGGDNGEEIGRAVEKCLHDWEISDVLTISAGNASSYDAAISYLGPKLVNHVLDGKFLRLKCFAEPTNATVKEVLKDYEKPIACVRATVSQLIQSPTRVRKFKKCAREHGIPFDIVLPLDSASSWISTYEMLYVFEKCKEVFNSFGDKDPQYIYELHQTCGIMDYADWEKVRKVIYFLQVFYESTEKILESRVTSNNFLEEISNIDRHLDNWGKSSTGSGKSFFKASELKWNFTSYWGDVDDSNLLIYMASILDPRHKTNCMEGYFLNSKYKHDYTREGEPTWKKKGEIVVAATYDLFNVYARKIGESHETAKFQTSGYMDYLYGDTAYYSARDVGLGGNVGCATEIDKYLAHKDYFEDYDGFDVLLWWKVHSEIFPVLSQMAKDILALPILAAALETAFNTDGNMLGDFKSSLSASMVEALVCTRDWINRSNKQIKVEEGSTKLADNFLKGIYEQLHGATNGCG
ncbi:hypothetical protein QVD17_07980 [Tagetes erecta]|uniref:HAT C-terminal dimerisation domain-containing protein n=1 Tax=Tagetes erecta TaxID=13708 RepID=A0AAD8NXB5_TARER|nr:hypothetical protein QVD17_07980 [Tagetes erecta]